MAHRTPVRLEDLLVPDHPLLKAAAEIPWEWLEAQFQEFAAPTEPLRLMLGLQILRLLKGLADEDLCTQWPENPYFQAFCGETFFRDQLPVSPFVMRSFRDAVGPQRLERLFLQRSSAASERLSTFVIDVDGVVATLTPGNDYRLCRPIDEVIAAINNLYDRGHHIVMLTARGTKTGLDWQEVTREQFRQWGLKYHELHFGKPAADYYVDDRMLNIEMLCAMAVGLAFVPSTRAPGAEPGTHQNENTAVATAFDGEVECRL